MKWSLAVLATLTAACATASTGQAPLDACSLQAETACVAYGAQVAGGPKTPSGQLTIGLADRAAQLPDEEAVDYWHRIEEIVSTSEDPHELTKRRAASAYASLAVLSADEVTLEGDDLDVALSDGQAALERVRKLSEFAIRWGEPPTQARGARAIADAYGRHAGNLANFEIPSELTISGRASFDQKRDAIVAALREEEKLLRAGVAEHCRRESLSIPECHVTPPKEAAPARPRIILASRWVRGAEELKPQSVSADAVRELQLQAEQMRRESSADWEIFAYAFDGEHLDFVRAELVLEAGDPRAMRRAHWEAVELLQVDRTAETVALFGLGDLIGEHEGGVCGIKVGMPLADVVSLLGEADEVRGSALTGCDGHRYGTMWISICTGVVRSVRRSDISVCPESSAKSAPD